MADVAWWITVFGILVPLAYSCMMLAGGITYLVARWIYGR